MIPWISESSEDYFSEQLAWGLTQNHDVIAEHLDMIQEFWNDYKHLIQFSCVDVITIKFYCLCSTEETYGHYYRYYRRQVAPKVDVRVVIAVSITVVSLLQVVKNNILFCKISLFPTLSILIFKFRSPIVNFW